MSKLSGKVAVISGGSSGIALSTARKFVEEGAYVFITLKRKTRFPLRATAGPQHQQLPWVASALAVSMAPKPSSSGSGRILQIP